MYDTYCTSENQHSRILDWDPIPIPDHFKGMEWGMEMEEFEVHLICKKFYSDCYGTMDGADIGQRRVQGGMAKRDG